MARSINITVTGHSSHDHEQTTTARAIATHLVALATAVDDRTTAVSVTIGSVVGTLSYTKPTTADA